MIAKESRYELRTIKEVGHEEHLAITAIVFTNGEKFEFSGSVSCFPPNTSVICLVSPEGRVVGVAGIKKRFSLSGPVSEAINYISKTTVGHWVSPIVHDAR